MKEVPQQAEFDGQQIRSENVDAERHDWLLLSSRDLEAAYGENEPEYSLDLIKEPNPDYDEGGEP
jgi:hypothetical protein